jgi:LemA protein
LLLVGLFVWLTYNRMVSKRQAVDNSFSQIDVALKRRHDLIPNLVEAVKGYAKHERKTFEEVTKARGAAQAASGPQPQAAAEGILASALGRLMAVAEAYPELKASENFMQLQTELSETEDQIQITRRVYNDTVETYNTLIQIFPPNLVANAFDFEARPFFEAPDGVEVAPDVSFAGPEAKG